MIRLTTLIAVAAALILVGTGCGGSKKSSASPSTGGTPTVANGTGSTPTVANGTGSSSGGSSSSGSGSSTSGSGSSGSSSSGSSSSSGGSSTVAKSCLNFAGAAAKLGQALGATGSASANSENVKTYLNGLASQAPSAIKGSFQTLAAAIGKYVDAIKGLNLKAGQTPSAPDLAKLQQAAAALETPEVKQASAKIQAWVKAGCHS
jgi:hypothetical protein